MAQGMEKKKILSDFNNRSLQIKEAGFVEKQYTEFSKSMISIYLNRGDSLTDTLVFRILNKISNNKLMIGIEQKKIKRHRMALINQYECEGSSRTNIERLGGVSRMNRRKKLYLNTVTALLNQVVALICGFILPIYILAYFGSDVNGLVTSMTRFLSVISFLELGIGPVIQSNLYKPLADNDTDMISKIVVSAERFYRKIAFIFLVYIVVFTICVSKHQYGV